MRQINIISKLKKKKTNINSDIDLNFDILINREQAFISIAFATSNKAFSTTLFVS